MKLSEIVKELTKQPKKPTDAPQIYTQQKLAEALGTNQPAIGQILAAKAWDTHWEVFLKLLPIAAEYGFVEIPAQKSQPPTPEEILYGETIGPTASSDESACQSRPKAAGSGTVPTGRAAKRKKGRR